MRALFLLAALPLALAGGAPARAQDGGPRDGGPRDAGQRDGPRDAGLRDAGAIDGGPRDAGAIDAGPRDAGPRDGGPRDAGAREAAARRDGGARDGGPIDGGPIDGGPGDAGPFDAGASDARDAGTGAGTGTGDEVPEVLSEDSGQVVRTLLGLVVLAALAWLASHKRVHELEERLGISQIATTGLPFVALGVLAHAPGIEILTPEVIVAMTPILQFGLGWIGFHTGFQFEAREMESVPPGTSSAVILLTGGSFVAISIACGAVMWGVGLGPSWTALARDAAIIGLAGALSAPTMQRISGSRLSAKALELARVVGVLDDVVGVGALAILFAWLHPADHGWELPGVGWLFVTFGMAVVLGLLVYAVLRGVESAADSTSLLLGCVCFAAGLAGVFSLPPLVVCFFAGMLLRNLPMPEKARLAVSFATLERPIYLVFLVVVGALWQLDDWRGWALLPVFVVSRVIGRWSGARAARLVADGVRHPGLAESSDRDLATPPMGALALAFVLTAQTLYESPAIQAIVTAVIAGSVVTEAMVQIGARAPRSSTVPPPPPDDDTVELAPREDEP